MRTAAAVAVSAAAVVVRAQAPAPVPMMQCNWQAGGFNGATMATFDLSPGFNATQDYAWADRNDLYVKNFSYYFQVCSNTISQQPSCQGKGASPAYQVDSSGNCYVLGSDLTPNPRSPVSYAYSPIEFSNPARGISLTYMGSDASGGCPAPRNFTLNLWCAPFPWPVAAPLPAPGANNSYNGFYWIDEFNVCSYVANSYSHLGCPTECPIVNHRLCGGNGVCGFDRNIQKARCFCNDDYIESDCSTSRYPYPTGTVAGSVIGGILVGVAGLAGAVFFIQRRRSAALGGPAGPVDGFYGQVA